MPESKNVTARVAVVPKKVLAAVIVFLLTLFSVWLSQTEAFKLATTHQPELFTELYFAEQSALPANITAGKDYEGSFVIVNHEGSPQNYTYQVVVSDGKDSHAQTPVKVHLKAGERRVLKFTYKSAEVGQSMVITINLDEVQQSIYFKAKS